MLVDFLRGKLNVNGQRSAISQSRKFFTERDFHLAKYIISYPPRKRFPSAGKNMTIYCGRNKSGKSTFNENGNNIIFLFFFDTFISGIIPNYVIQIGLY